VSFIVIAYNEVAAIRDKIANTLELDYPPDRLEMIVASDGSTDGTDAIVDSYPDPRVKLVRNPNRKGKTTTTCLAVEAATGEVLIFSDATGVYNREALHELIAPLVNPEIGAVSGRVIYTYDTSQTATGFRRYQTWVVAQRRSEATLHTLTSASGSIHAIRRELFEPLPDHLDYDMAVPALVAKHGKRVAYAAGATSLEVSRSRAKAEFAARVRIAVRAYGFLSWLWAHRTSIRDRGYWIQLFFHKVLRWFSAHLLLLLLISHLFIASEGGLAAALLWPHLGLYLLAALLARFERTLRFPGSGTFLLFATVNAAYLVAFFRWLRGARVTIWGTGRSD